MDYVNPIQQRKRHREEEHSQWECHSQAVKCDVLMDSPIDSWDTLQISNQNSTSLNNHTGVVDTTVSTQCCPRCMAGEPGHINHIMQRY